MENSCYSKNFPHLSSCLKWMRSVCYYISGLQKPLRRLLPEGECKQEGNVIAYQASLKEGEGSNKEEKEAKKRGKVLDLAQCYKPFPPLAGATRKLKK